MSPHSSLKIAALFAVLSAVAVRAAEAPLNWHGAPPLAPPPPPVRSAPAPLKQAPPLPAPAKEAQQTPAPVVPISPGKDPEGRAAALLKLADAYKNKQKFAEALDAASDALALLEARFGANDRRLAPALSALGGIYWRQGRREEAEPYYRRASAILEKGGAKGPDKSGDGNSLELAHALSEQAKLYLNSKRIPEAVPLQRRALAIYETAYKNQPDTLRTYLIIASNTEIWAGNYAEALSLLARAAATTDPKNPASRAFVDTEVARVYAKQGRHADAVALLQNVIAVYEKRFGKDHRALVVPVHALADSLRVLGRTQEADAAKRRADGLNGRGG